MPVYEYSCEKCDLKFEVSRPMAERNNLTPCPECKVETSKRYYGNVEISIRCDDEKICKGKRAGLDVEKYKYIREARDKRKKDSGASDYAQKSNELWCQGKVSGDNRLNLKKK